MLIAAIAIILLVVGGVGTMSVVMQENAEVADEVIVVANHVDERIQEEVDVTRDSAGLKLLNVGPEIEILEYRVLGDDGTLILSCPASLKVGTSQKEIVDGTKQALKPCWDEYDDPAELFQVVTARGKIFTLSEAGSGNSTTTTIIIDNSTHTVINNTLTGGGVGFGFLPQIDVYEPPIKMVAWGNSTHTDASSVVRFKRVGEVSYTAVVRASDALVSFTIPPFSGEYRMAGGLMRGTNDLSVRGSDWDNHDGWLELSKGLNGTEPYTSVVRIDDYYIRNNILNFTGYSSENATIKIVSSPNDLTRLALAGDGFAPEVLPIDSYLNYTKVLVNSYASSYSTARNTPITHDLFECVEYSPGRGYKCHEFAHPSYPAEIYTDFYAKDCDDAVETRRVGSVYVLDGVTAGYTEGVYNSTGTYSADFEEWKSVTLNTPPVIECGPKIDGYHHVTKISQNQTTPYSDTYRFGPDQGMSSRGDLLTEIHGNVTLNNGDHIMLFETENAGLFKETVDLRRNAAKVTNVIVDLDIASGRLGYLYLDAPDGQRNKVCGIICDKSSYSINFDPVNVEGDWGLYWSRVHNNHVRLNSWGLTLGITEFPERIFSPPQGPGGSYGVNLGDTLTVLNGTTITPYTGDLYLMAIDVKPNETVMLRANDYVSPSLLGISNLPSYAPYEITHGDVVLKDGMTDGSGRIEIQHSEVAIELTEPIVFKYWPNSLTYVGNHHANGKGILFDPYHDRVISFPWDPADPLLYVAKAYVRMTIPVDDMSLDGIRLYNRAGQHVSYPYLTGTYDAGDEVYVPIFPATTEIHLQINGDWVQSYVKDVQQNTRALVFGGIGNIEGVELTETATIFATKPGEVVALISATATGSSTVYFYADYSGAGGRYADVRSYFSNIDYYGQSNAESACSSWNNYVSRPNVENLHETTNRVFNEATSGGVIAVSVYRNGILVDHTSSTVADSDDAWVFYTPSHCLVIGPLGGEFPSSLGNPWGISLTKSVNFNGEAFISNVIVSGVEAGDQIDFVLHSGSGFEMQNPMPYSPRSMSSGSSGEFTIESGYIVIYQ